MKNAKIERLFISLCKMQGRCSALAEALEGTEDKNCATIAGKLWCITGAIEDFVETVEGLPKGGNQ